MRKRMTWNDGGVRQRRASEQPATPNEGPASPAYKAEPAADAYETGDPSAWAEDPRPGPYPNGEHPATPDEGPASPAYKAAALEQKAAKCIRLATAMLGDDATVNAIEDQALVLMDLSDRSIQASLARLAEDADEAIDEDDAAEAEEEEAKKKASVVDSRIARLERILTKLAGDDEDDEDDDEEEEVEEEEVEEEASSKKASSLERRIARIENVLIRLAEEEASDDEEAADKEANPIHRQISKRKAGYYMDDMEHMAPEAMEDALLEEMLREEGMIDGEDEAMEPSEAMEDALLEEMLREESMMPMPEAMEPEAMEPEAMEPEAMEPEAMGHMEHMDAEPEHMMDPMMPVEGDLMEEDEMLVLAKLFNDRAAADEKEEKAEEKAAETVQEEVEHEAEEKAEEKAEKKAALRPQPKKASTGARTLGAVSKEASSEVGDLSKLWESAPDVSKFF